MCAAAQLPLRPEGMAAAAHIIGYKLVIRLLPKLDLTSFPCSNAAARRCNRAFALEVHGKIRTLPVTDVRTLLIRFCVTPDSPSQATLNDVPTIQTALSKHLGILLRLSVLRGHLTSDAGNFATRKSRCWATVFGTQATQVGAGNITFFSGI